MFSRLTVVLQLLEHLCSLGWTHPSAVYLGSTQYSHHLLHTLGFDYLPVSLSSFVMKTWDTVHLFTEASCLPRGPTLTHSIGCVSKSSLGLFQSSPYFFFPLFPFSHIAVFLLVFHCVFSFPLPGISTIVKEWKWKYNQRENRQELLVKVMSL